MTKIQPITPPNHLGSSSSSGWCCCSLPVAENDGTAPACQAAERQC